MKFIQNKIEKWDNSLKKRYDGFFLKNTQLKTFLFGKEIIIQLLKEKDRKRIHIKFNQQSNIYKLNELFNENYEIKIKTPFEFELITIKKNFYRTFLKNYEFLYWNEVKMIIENYKIKKNWNLLFKDLIGSWGLCKNRKNEIVLAKKLIHYPFEIQYYVMVHEVAHIIVPNHSRKFWEIVSLQCPNYKDLRKRLRW